jgi:hypothetical protein
MAHFAKIFGISWAIIMALYILAISRVGFAAGWRGQTPLSISVLKFIFYAWPVVPAVFTATIWELTRVTMIRKH